MGALLAGGRVPGEQDCEALGGTNLQWKGLKESLCGCGVSDKSVRSAGPLLDLRGQDKDPTCDCEGFTDSSKISRVSTVGSPCSRVGTRQTQPCLKPAVGGLALPQCPHRRFLACGMCSVNASRSWWTPGQRSAHVHIGVSRGVHVGEQ